MHEKGLKECIHYTFNSLVCFQIIPRNILKARKYSLKNQRNEVLIINKNVQSLFYIVLISIHTTHTQTHTQPKTEKIDKTVSQIFSMKNQFLMMLNSGIFIYAYVCV